MTGAFGQASYHYDAQRLRTRKTSAAGTRVYHYDLQGRLNAETRGDRQPIRAYVWDDSQPIAQVDYAPGNEKLYCLHTDHRATPRLATDESQRVVWRYEAEAFGASLPDEDPDGDGVTTVINLRLAGQYHDQETGLHYNWHRYYDPRIGRYLTPDRMSVPRHVRRWQGGLGQPGQWPLELNPYLYVSANPWRWVDPTGMYQCTYSIAAHTMTCTPNDPSHGTFSSSDFGSGRSGAGCNDCQNNPDRTNVTNWGPHPSW